MRGGLSWCPSGGRRREEGEEGECGAMEEEQAPLQQQRDRPGEEAWEPPLAA